MMNETILFTDLDEWNLQLTQRLIPNTVVLVFYFVTGLFGNGLVLFVYKFGFKGNTENRYFIPVLALFDLFASITCSSFTFALNFQQANFESESFCKSMWFLSASTTIMSVLTLLAITVERYIHVFRPFRAPPSQQTKRIVLISIVSIAVCISLPSTIFYGKVSSYSVERNVTRWRCTITTHWKNNEPVLYALVLSVFVISTPICTSILYSMIGYKLYKQLKFRKQFQRDFVSIKEQVTLSKFEQRTTRKSQRNIPDTGMAGIYQSTLSNIYTLSENTSATDIHTGSICNADSHSDLSLEPSNKDSGRNTQNNALQYRSGDERCSNIVVLHNPEAAHRGINTGSTLNEEASDIENVKLQSKHNMHHFTFMFMLIVGFCALTYLPKIILLVLETTNKTFWVDIPDKYLGTVLFFYRFYIFNNVCNPFVYCFVDMKFRDELKSLCRCRK